MKQLRLILLYLAVFITTCNAQTPSGYNAVQQSTLGTGVASALGQAITGSGSLVGNTGPTLITPNIGVVSGGDVSAATAMATASTTPRTLAARAADFFNVRDNGIVCDGTTDTSGAVSTMMTKVSSAGGGDVFWPAQAQPCMIGSYFSVPSNVRLWAVPGTVILMATATNTSNPTLISISGTSYLRINGLTLDGNVSNNTTLSNFITVYQASNVIFSDVTVQNTNGIGLLFSTNVDFHCSILGSDVG